jgi:hypothetical protein
MFSVSHPRSVSPPAVISLLGSVLYQQTVEPDKGSFANLPLAHMVPSEIAQLITLGTFCRAPEEAGQQRQPSGRKSARTKDVCVRVHVCLAKC